MHPDPAIDAGQQIADLGLHAVDGLLGRQRRGHRAARLEEPQKPLGVDLLAPEQTRVLQRDRSLLADPGRELELVGREPAFGFGLEEHQDPEGLVFVEERHVQRRELAPVRHLDARVLVDGLVGELFDHRHPGVEDGAVARHLGQRQGHADLGVARRRLGLGVGARRQRVARPVELVEDAARRADGARAGAGHGVDHLFEDEARRERPAGVEQRPEAPLGGVEPAEQVGVDDGDGRLLTEPSGELQLGFGHEPLLVHVVESQHADVSFRRTATAR